MDDTPDIESRQTRLQELLIDAHTETERLPKELNLNQTISELQQTIETLNQLDYQTEQD